MITHHPYSIAQLSGSPVTAAWPWMPTVSQRAVVGTGNLKALRWAGPSADGPGRQPVSAIITPEHLHATVAQVADIGQLTGAWADVLAGDRSSRRCATSRWTGLTMPATRSRPV